MPYKYAMASLEPTAESMPPLCPDYDLLDEIEWRQVAVDSDDAGDLWLGAPNPTGPGSPALHRKNWWWTRYLHDNLSASDIQNMQGCHGKTFAYASDATGANGPLESLRGVQEGCEHLQDIRFEVDHVFASEHPGAEGDGNGH